MKKRKRTGKEKKKVEDNVWECKTEMYTYERFLGTISLFLFLPPKFISPPTPSSVSISSFFLILLKAKQTSKRSNLKKEEKKI